MRVLILGGDGYLGWPTAMHLSARGHQVAVVDNYLRRRLVREEDVETLFETPNLHERARFWHAASGCRVSIFVGDLTHWEVVAEVFREFHPDAVVHYAEQPSAPYSMLNRRAATVTLQNNLLVTANAIFAVREYAPEAHIIKLGTMGEYGVPNIDIEEGWLDIEHRGRKGRFLFPRQAGSLYHTTKIMDTDLLWFYVRMWNLRVTDLMQGPVYGMVTEETGTDERLFPFFNYDEIFGTVLNRFLVQAVAGYPLTVYGKGGQTRGYLDIRDTMQCVRLALEHPPAKGELRILNQFVELFSVNKLAEMVQRVGNKLDLGVHIQKIENPRKEAEEHYYNPVHRGLLELGLQPHYLNDEVLAEMLQLVGRYRDKIREDNFLRGVKWD